MQHECIKIVGNIWIERFGWRRLFGNMFGQQLLRIFATEWWSPTDSFVTRCPEAVYVCPAVENMSAYLFWRHVTPCALGFSAAAEPLSHAFWRLIGDGEIDEFRFAE